MYKKKSNCSTCKLTNGNPQLRRRIYQAKFYPLDGGETLADICREYHLSYQTMYNHVKKHITDRGPIRDKQAATIISKVKAKIEKETELSLDHDSIVPEQEFEKGLREYISMGMEKLERGEMQVTSSGFLAAIKIKADISAKKRGQDVEIIKTMYRFGNTLPTKGLTDGSRDT